MTTVPCPRCAKPVGLEVEICPHCRTPRDDMEMEEGRALVRKEELRLKRRPRLIAAGGVAALVLAVAWSLRGYALVRLNAAWQDFQAEVEKTREVSHWIKDKPLEPAALINTSAPAAKEQVAVSSFVYVGGGFTFPSSGPSPAPPPPTSRPAPMIPPPDIPGVNQDFPPNPDPYMRIFYGRVYDLMTLEPLAGANLKFRSNGQPMSVAATTDSQGRYRFNTHRQAENGNTLVSVETVPGYREGQLEDRDPPLRERTVDARRQLAEETNEFDLGPVPLRFKESDDVVELDLVVIPKTVR